MLRHLKLLNAHYLLLTANYLLLATSFNGFPVSARDGLDQELVAPEYRGASQAKVAMRGIRHRRATLGIGDSSQPFHLVAGWYTQTYY